MSNKRYTIEKDDFYEDQYNKLLALHKRFKKRAFDILSGRNRNVFIMNGYVIKLPRNIYGAIDNEWEGCISNANDDPEEIRYARTRLAYFNGVPIIFMEYVEYASNEKMKTVLGKVPSWTLSVDCGQVGFNKKGKLLAFDYGRT